MPLGNIIEINLGYYAIGDTFCQDVTVRNSDDNKSGDIATNVQTIITLPPGLTFQGTASAVPQGTFSEATGIWKIGSLLPCQEVTGTFCFEVTDDCPSPYEIQITSSSDACDCNLQYPQQCIVAEGSSCCDIGTCIPSLFIYLF